jgi:hypothetical protein
MLDPSKWTAEQNTKVFLKVMGGLEAECHFRTFSDRDRTSAQALTRKLSGCFDDHAATLQQMNDAGAGVFMVINKGGNRDADITSVRALFADTDGAPLEPIIEALRPHLVVSTSLNKSHVYWRVHDFPLEKFKPTQTHIAKTFGCDPSVNNPARVMRLPGFNHCKGDPLPVRIVHIDAQLKLYSYSDIVGAFGINKSAEVAETLTPNCSLGTSLLQSLRSNPYSLSEVEEMLRFIDPREYVTWRNAIFALVHEYGEDSRELARRWSRGYLWECRGRK